MDEVRRAVLDADVATPDDDKAWAATALVLHDHPEHGPEILFIERAKRRGDRWSGQMALPGGKRDPIDPDLVETARREAREEVGVVLDRPIGRLPDAGSRRMGGFVACVAFEIDRRPQLTLQESEVAAAVWIPLSHLLDPANAEKYRYRGFGPFQSIRHGEHVVWGMTWGILEQFSELLGRSLPRV